QSARLEAMQERQATVEGETFPLDRPFFVIATQNPIEHEGTYPLPEAQVDRFLLKIDVGYPTREQEIEVLERRRKRRADDATIEAVTTPDQIRALQAAIEDVHVEPAAEGYMVDIVAAMPALAHRIILKPDPWIRGVRTSAVLADVLSQVPVPKVP